MEVFGFIIAVVLGAGLAIYKEANFQKKLDVFHSSQAEFTRLNKRLEKLVRSNHVEHENLGLDVEAERVRKALDMHATIKFVNAYIKEMDEAPYRQPGFLTNTPYSQNGESKVGVEDSDCYVARHFSLQAESYA